ncbi:MAG: alanine dehydrogenase, partial [Actinomycetota bacterium]
MLVGVPKEIKNNENRVAMTPAGVFELVNRGHQVLVETAAGVGSGFSNQDYLDAGAKIADSAKEVWAAAEMIVKVKEPISAEYPLMRKGQVLFTYLHLAASKDCTDAIVASGTTAIAYET